MNTEGVLLVRLEDKLIVYSIITQEILTKHKGKFSDAILVGKVSAQSIIDCNNTDSSFLVAKPTKHKVAEL